MRTERERVHEDGPGVALTESPAHLGEEERRGFKGRWDEIQASFIDEPRRSVEEANELVRDLTERVTERFRNERQRLEERWEEGEEVSTEDLRVTLQRYRSFFDRLLAI
ncbi:MAG: hypothetical protein KY397_04130 [Gemmatimonadetes bacterium]|nr:hypothetical protein [Gemmatimonadota bacterium]